LGRPKSPNPLPLERRFLSRSSELDDELAINAAMAAPTTAIEAKSATPKATRPAASSVG